MVWISLSLMTLTACDEPRTVRSPTASSPRRRKCSSQSAGGCRTHSQKCQRRNRDLSRCIGDHGHTRTLLDSFQGAASEAFVVHVAKAGFHEVTLRDMRTTELMVILRPPEIMHLAAAYTLTFEAAACESLPADVRRRTYTVSIEESDPFVPGFFRGALGGADFYPGYNALSVTVGQDRGLLMVFSWYSFQPMARGSPHL